MRRGVSLRRCWAIAKKELVHMRRDRASLGMALVMPLVLLLVFGYAVNTDVEHLPTAVWDQSQSKASRELVAAFQASRVFAVCCEAQGYRDVQARLDAGQIKAALIVPPDYATRLEEGRPVRVQVLLDGSDPTAARTALSAAHLVVQHQAALLQQAALRKDGVLHPERLLDVETRVLYNPAMTSVVFNIPGLIGVILQNVTVLLTAFSLVREKERGTMEQLIVTPIRRMELMLGKLAPYVGIGLFSFSAVLATGVWWFGVPVKGSVALLCVLGLLFLVTTLAIGLLISTVAKTQLEAVQLTFALLLPSILLSGFVFPRETMPWLIRAIGELIPITHFLVILRGIFLKGVGMDVLWKPTLILCGFAVLFCGLAVWRFRKTLG